jgi:hypothetical protein
MKKTPTIKYVCRKCGCVSHAKKGSQCQIAKVYSNCSPDGRGRKKGKPSKYRVGWTKQWMRVKGKMKLEPVHVRDHK